MVSARAFCWSAESGRADQTRAVDFATAVSQHLLEGLDHRRQRKEAPVLSEEAEEFRGERTELGGLATMPVIALL